MFGALTFDQNLSHVAIRHVGYDRMRTGDMRILGVKTKALWRFNDMAK